MFYNGSKIFFFTESLKLVMHLILIYFNVMVEIRKGLFPSLSHNIFFYVHARDYASLFDVAQSNYFCDCLSLDFMPIYVFKYRCRVITLLDFYLAVAARQYNYYLSCA